MGKYTDAKCIICNQKFKDDDDIVVCPDCGTPYHRDCWSTQGRCINTSLHAVGGTWTGVMQEQRLQNGGKICPHCQFVNRPDAARCESCNGMLEENTVKAEPANFSFELDDPCCGHSPEEPIEEERLGDVAHFVKTNTNYYIPLFRRFRDSGRKASLNFTCILFPNLYFAYRKMWFMAVLSSLLLLICGLPRTLVGMLTTLTEPEFMSTMENIYGSETLHMFDGLTVFLQNHQSLLESLYIPMYLVNVCARILFCLFGNHMYYRFVLHSVSTIRQHTPNALVRNMVLGVEGGTSFWNIIGCGALYYAAVFAVYMILMLVFA